MAHSAAMGAGPPAFPPETEDDGACRKPAHLGFDMYLVLSAVVLVAALMYVQGTLAYYRHPAAPEWLRSRKSLQVVISGMFNIGLIGSVFLFIQFLLTWGSHRFGLLDAALLAATVVVHVVTSRWIAGAEDRSVARSATVVDLPVRPAPSTPSRPIRRGRSRKAA